MLRSLGRLTGLMMVAVLLTTVVGCGEGTGGKAKIAGAVTYQGEAIPEGEIIFTPISGEGETVAGKISQGKYTCDVPPGKAQVRITGYRPVPGKFDTSNPGEKTPLIEMFIPEKYNSRSTLEVTVEGSNSALDFTLTKT